MKTLQFICKRVHVTTDGARNSWRIARCTRNFSSVRKCFETHQVHFWRFYEKKVHRYLKKAFSRRQSFARSALTKNLIKLRRFFYFFILKTETKFDVSMCFCSLLLFIKQQFYQLNQVNCLPFACRTFLSLSLHSILIIIALKLLIWAQRNNQHNNFHNC